MIYGLGEIGIFSSQDDSLRYRQLRIGALGPNENCFSLAQTITPLLRDLIETFTVI